MTTANPLKVTNVFSPLNMTTKEDPLYTNSGAIVAAVVVVVIIIITVVLLFLKKYNSSRQEVRGVNSSRYATGDLQDATQELELKEIKSEKKRARGKLEPKGLKSAFPSTYGSKRSNSRHSAAVTFSPDNIEIDAR